MTDEPRRPGRPKKHLQDDHHYKPASETVTITENLVETAIRGDIILRTPDNAEAAGAPPASADSGQADASDGALAPDSASAEYLKEWGGNAHAGLIDGEIVEAVVENPTIVLDVGNQEDSVTKSSTISPESQTIGQPDVSNVDIIGNLSQNQESPIEKKIHELADVSGWKHIHTEIVLQMPPRNGIPVRLSTTPEGDGVLAIWKKTRKFANPTHRWEESGKWVDFQSGMDISFKPNYWKERY